MVRKYERKARSRAHRKEYSEQQLLAAITAVKTKNISIYKASKEFNILYATLHHKCTVKPEKLRKHGGQTQHNFRNGISYCRDNFCINEMASTCCGPF